MTPRDIRFTRQAARFMPRLWDFAYPPGGRGYGVMRRIALRAWCRAVQLRWVTFEAWEAARDSAASGNRHQ